MKNVLRTVCVFLASIMALSCFSFLPVFSEASERVIKIGDESARYGSYLKCDIVQVSHHGLASDSNDPAEFQRRLNSTKEIYTLTDPDIALWPTSVERYEDRMRCSVNRHLASVVDPDYIDGAEIYGDGIVSVKNFYIAEQNNFTVTFKQ